MERVKWYLDTRFKGVLTLYIYISQIESGSALSVLLSTTIFVITVVKMLWTHEAHTTNFDHCDEEYRCRKEYRQHWTTFDLPFYHNIILNAKEIVYFRAWPKSWHKKRASVVYNFLAICLVYFLKWAFLIVYYIAWQIDASMTRAAFSS